MRWNFWNTEIVHVTYSMQKECVYRDTWIGQDLRALPVRCSKALVACRLFRWAGKKTWLGLETVWYWDGRKKILVTWSDFFSTSFNFNWCCFSDREVQWHSSNSVSHKVKDFNFDKLFVKIHFLFCQWLTSWSSSKNSIKLTEAIPLICVSILLF